MSIFKDIKSLFSYHETTRILFRYHETTRLLIEVADQRLNQQSMRIHYLEEKIQKLENK